ncbi:MAG TPA: hypothetical protein VH813_03210 [Candidatus Limnocylindrales bacterium]
MTDERTEREQPDGSDAVEGPVGSATLKPPDDLAEGRRDGDASSETDEPQPPNEERT